MKFVSFIVLAVTFMLLQSNIQAFGGDVPCNDLDELITNIDKLNNSLDKLEAKDIDDELDKTLKEVADSLVELSGVVPGLKGPADKLSAAYKDKNLPDYQKALDICANKLEDHYNKNCK